MMLTAGPLSFFARWLTTIIPPPAYWPPELKGGGAATGAIPTEFMGQQLAGNWWILITLLVSLSIATFGEEFWWRGYILPRQELAFGKYTWLIHGFMWACFHLFAPWNFFGILPGCLALAYVTQRLKNTWPAVIAHGLANGLLVLIVILLSIFR
jgi:membrane protease YdiL (CAAX protease family)